MSWNPAALLSDSQIKDAKKTDTVDPSLFLGKDVEQRVFLQSHKDILTLSPQESIYLKYTTIKGVFGACPGFVRILLTLIFVIIIITIVPILLSCFLKVFKTKKTELASIALLLLAVTWVWKSWVSDL